jgi:arylsulfatase A-like enzyme
LRRLGQLDNTILVVLADNGASQEGGPFGVLHEMKFFNGIIEMPDEAVARIDDIGGPNSHANYPWGWAQCGNTPFRWYKQNTHEGGVHVPMVLHWPAGVPADQAGTTRDQFVFVADIVPTIYELLGVEPPAVRRGLEQLPVTGHSFAHVLADPAAPASNHGAVLRERRQPRDRRRRLEGRLQAHPRHRLRHRGLGAVRPARRPLRVPRPGRRAARPPAPS